MDVIQGDIRPIPGLPYNLLFFFFYKYEQHIHLPSTTHNIIFHRPPTISHIITVRALSQITAGVMPLSFPFQSNVHSAICYKSQLEDSPAVAPPHAQK